MSEIRCSVCGAVLPESLICEYCGANNSPQFQGKFDEDYKGTLEINGETIACYIGSIYQYTNAIEIPSPGDNCVSHLTIRKRKFELIEM